MSKSAELKYRYNLPREIFDYLEELELVEQQNKELKGIINFIKNDLLDLKETGLSDWQELLVNRSIDMIG